MGNDRRGLIRISAMFNEQITDASQFRQCHEEHQHRRGARNDMPIQLIGNIAAFVVSGDHHHGGIDKAMRQRNSPRMNTPPSQKKFPE